MKRYLSIIIVLGVMLVFFAGCATLRTFDLAIDGQKVVINLPKDFPSMDEAIFTGEMCWDAKLCAMGFCLSNKPGHGHVRFFYSGKDIVALNWCAATGIEGCRQWLFVKGGFIGVDSGEFAATLDAIWKKPSDTI